MHNAFVALLCVKAEFLFDEDEYDACACNGNECYCTSKEAHQYVEHQEADETK